MARPVTTPDERIIDAARDLFLEKGIKVTVEDVARRLGISEGTVFHRFGTKADLFRCAMKPQLDDPAWVVLLTSRVGDGDLPARLVAAGLEGVAFYRKIIPLVMMAWSNPDDDGLPAYIKDPNHPSMRVLKRIASWFEAEMRAGNLRRHDPEIVARSFVGALWHYAWNEIALQAQDILPMPTESYVRGLVSLLWGGLSPTKTTPARGRR